MSLWCTFVAVYGTIVAGFGIAYFFDYIVVFLMKQFHLPLFPTAVNIAMLILRHPEQWIGSTHTMSHPDIGEIWTGNAAYGIEVRTQFGTWKPNRIERRIIREAVDWRIGEFIRNRIDVAVQRRTLQ